MSGAVLWDERDRAEFQATAERGEQEGWGKEWAAYVDHVRATVPEESEREQKLFAAMTICAHIRFASRLVREASESRSKAIEVLEVAKRVRRTAGADAERARIARRDVTAAQELVKHREGYLWSLQAVQRNLANGNILAAFVCAFHPPLLHTPPQAEAKVNGRPYAYNREFAEGRAMHLWSENPDLTITAMVKRIIEENPAEFGGHFAGLRRLLAKVREHLQPPR